MPVLKFIHTFIQQFHFLVGLLTSKSELSFMTTILISFAFEMQSKFQLGLSLLHFQLFAIFSGHFIEKNRESAIRAKGDQF